MTTREAEIVGLIKKEVKPALGGTEPIAIAPAAAIAMESIMDNCTCCTSSQWRISSDLKVDVHVSGNFLKNWMGADTPDPGTVGDISCRICDGANVGCAVKVASGFPVSSSSPYLQ